MAAATESTDPSTRFRSLSLALFVLALAHALATWPLALAVAFFAVGGLLAFAAEALGVALGLFRHHAGPRVAGVPLHVVAAWPAISYLAYRLARLALPPGANAVVAAAVLATAFDVLVDHRGVAAGHWTYPDRRVSRPRFRGVPWWNYVGWFVLVALTASIPTLAWGR